MRASAVVLVLGCCAFTHAAGTLAVTADSQPQRISLDLDDGVKVNYGKFGNLLAEVKAIAGSDE